jgi:hypothetical protein
VNRIPKADAASALGVSDGTEARGTIVEHGGSHFAFGVNGDLVGEYETQLAAMRALPSSMTVKKTKKPRRRLKKYVVRLSDEEREPRSNHQKPGRGIAERLRDPSCRRSSDQASRSLAARLQGGAIRGRVCAFLTTRAEHPNTLAWGRRKDVKVFGCSDDCARCGTAKEAARAAIDLYDRYDRSPQARTPAAWRCWRRCGGLRRWSGASPDRRP